MEPDKVREKKEFWKWANANKPKALTMREKLLKELERQENPMTVSKIRAWLTEQRIKRSV